MKAHGPSMVTTTTGILIGLEIGEWAGFPSGRLVVRRNDGRRMEFRYGKESRGLIPKIGGLIAVEHTKGTFPEILKIEIITEPKSNFYQDVSKGYDSSFLWGRPTGLVLIVFTEVIIGFLLVLVGLSERIAKPMAPVIYGLCGIPHIIIGYVLWYYGGQ